MRLVEFFGGASRAFVPDQLKSGVVVASRYEPEIQRTYEEWSQHYSTTILPARPVKPRDNAKVEGGFLIAQRWILARLRNVTCFSLDELNERIAALLVDFNSRVIWKVLARNPVADPLCHAADYAADRTAKQRGLHVLLPSERSSSAFP